jgi:hypothetical protein
MDKNLQTKLVTKFLAELTLQISGQTEGRQLTTAITQWGLKRFCKFSSSSRVGSVDSYVAIQTRHGHS